MFVVTRLRLCRQSLDLLVGDRRRPRRPAAVPCGLARTSGEGYVWAGESEAARVGLAGLFSSARCRPRPDKIRPLDEPSAPSSFLSGVTVATLSVIAAANGSSATSKQSKHAACSRCLQNPLAGSRLKSFVCMAIGHHAQRKCLRNWLLLGSNAPRGIPSSPPNSIFGKAGQGPRGRPLDLVR